MQFTDGLERLSRVFTPHRPIDLPELLSGRLPLLYRGIDAVNTEGLHIIFFGDRGTGKTSLAKVLGHLVQDEAKDSPRVLMAACSSSDDFTAIWRRVFQEILVAPRQMGFSPDSREVATHRMADFSGTEPNDVRLMVQSLPNYPVIIIDEFDRVPGDGDTRALMADTMKLFSDAGVRATIVLVGVAHSIEDLVAEHQSVARNIAQIAVDPMTPDELQQIVRSGYEKSGLEFDEQVPVSIAHLSQGYPHYTHLLALWAGRKALESGSSLVTVDHLDLAIPAALENATGNVQQEYLRAVDSVHSEALFREVLLACALTPKDSLGRFSSVDVRQPLADVLGREVAMGTYQSHLSKFCESERGPVLVRSGRRRSYRWRFANPQIIPFVLLQGRRDELGVDRSLSLL